jgi:hypothetical protein
MAGRSNQVCLDAEAGVAASQSAEVVSFPASNQSQVPQNFAPLQEFPDPLPAEAGNAGFPVTVTFFPTTASPRVEDAKAKLYCKNEEVPAWISWPGNPANPSRQANSNSLCIIPKSALVPDTVYSVHIEATVNGKKTKWEWQFRTTKN